MDTQRNSLELAIARAAIAASPRGDVLDRLAFERFADIATQVDLILAAAPGQRAELLALAGRLWKRAADLISGGRYYDGYYALDRIPAVLRDRTILETETDTSAREISGGK